MMFWQRSCVLKLMMLQKCSVDMSLNGVDCKVTSFLICLSKLLFETHNINDMSSQSV